MESYNLKLRQKLRQYSELPNYCDIEARGFFQRIKEMSDITVICSLVQCPDTGEDIFLLFHDSPLLCLTTYFDKHDQEEYVIPQRVGSLKEGMQYLYLVGKSESGYISIHNGIVLSLMCHWIR